MPDESAQRRVLDALLAARRVVVTGHVKPDGDALGSALALVGFLRDAGRDALAVGIEPLPESLLFLEGAGSILPADRYVPLDGDLLCLVDCAAPQRIHARLRPYCEKLPLAIIDHHWPTAPYPTEAVYAVPDYSSTSELVYDLSRIAGWPLTHPIAEALWTGIATDTNRFSYPCTRPSTLRCAAELLEKGAVRAQLIADESYNLVSLRRFRLQQRLMANLRLLCGGRLAIAHLAPEDYAAEGATTADSANFVDIPRFVRGVSIAAFVYPSSTGASTCLSLRTSDDAHDAAAFCARWPNGGGHARAAGATIRRPFAETLPDIEAALIDFLD